MAKEPCVVCSEDTAIGTVFFSDRHIVHDQGAEPTYVCVLCLPRFRSARGERLTEAEVSAALLGTDRSLPLGGRHRGGLE
jgi:hypothetical protein